ncbi:DUF6297 family protein [Specibacter cremeus]|uniref:DUF6297 family protein n=1 Tax=Specibacter cremeus TaxID=1629051 RepID=UPI000F78C5D3|nr:DUF6297 family protein [Specibacter cremeus]
MSARTQERFSAREIRQYTFRAGLSRSEGGLMELISEGYTYVLGAVVLLVMSGAVVVGLRNSLGIGNGSGFVSSVLSPDFHAVSLLQASATVLLTLAGALLSVEMSVGPITMSVPQTAWWLGLPVRRRGFIQPGFLLSMVWPTAAAIAVVVPLTLGLPGAPQPGRIALAVLCGIGVGLLLYGVAAWAQITNSLRFLKGVAGVLTLVAPLTLVVTALYDNAGAGHSLSMDWLAYLPTGWPLLVAQGSLWPLVVLPAALALLLRAYASLERITTGRLRAAAAAGAYVQGSLLSMDASELSRSLGGGNLVGRSRVRLPVVFRRGTATARSIKTLISTHATMLLRQPAQLARVLVLAAIPASVASVAHLGNAILIAFVLYLCGHLAATTLGGTARFAAGNPAVDRLMPLPERTVRRTHWVLPAGGMTLWALVCFLLLHALGAASWPLVILAVCAGPGLGGATIRAAFRPSPDWTMPAVASPLGPVPTGAVRSFLVGPDLSLITLLPVLICLVAGGVPLIAFPIQLLLSTLAYAWGTRVRRRKKQGEGFLASLAQQQPPAKR